MKGKEIIKNKMHKREMFSFYVSILGETNVTEWKMKNPFRMKKRKEK
jgi:hypothetical protein